MLEWKRQASTGWTGENSYLLSSLPCKPPMSCLIKNSVKKNKKKINDHKRENVNNYYKENM